MTKKDYVAIAEVIRNIRKLTFVRHAEHGQDVVNILAKQLCKVFAADNGRFKKSVFLSAAGGDNYEDYS